MDLTQRFTHEDQDVAWDVMGDGPPLILIHGFPWSAQAWRKVAPWLASRRRVYLFDMIGAGASEKRAKQDVSPAAQNQLLAALIRHWGLEKPEVAAHDFGGLCALRGMFLNGLDYGRLTLIDAVGVLPSGSPFFAHVNQHEDAFAGLPAYAHSALFRAYVNAAAHRPLTEEALALYEAPWRGEDGQAAFYRTIAQAGDGFIKEAMVRYQKPACPVRLLWARHDSFIPLAQGRELAERLGAEHAFTVIEDAGHAVQEDAPEALVGALTAEM